MGKKRVFIIISAIFIFLLVVIFLPWKMEYNKFNKDCENYCEDLKNASGLKGVRYGLECELPLGGCFSGCFGFRLGESCSRRSKCFNSCETTCFGLGFSLCGSSIIRRKINFLSNRGGE